MEAEKYSVICPTIPGADWYINGRRYQEVNRTPTPDGYTVTLEPSAKL